VQKCNTACNGRRIQLKIKCNDFPFLLHQKLKSLSKSSGKSFVDIVVYMLDNEVKSAEKILGEIKLD